MLIEKSISGDSRSLNDNWAAYRKKEVQVEMKLRKEISEPEPEPETISREEIERPSKDIEKVSNEIETFGDRVVKVQVVEYMGKRKKEVTHIEVKEAELEEMLKNGHKFQMAQFTLF